MDGGRANEFAYQLIKLHTWQLVEMRKYWIDKVSSQAKVKMINCFGIPS